MRRISSKSGGWALDGGVRASFDVRKLRCRVVSLGDLIFHNRSLSCGFVCEGIRRTGLQVSCEIVALAFRSNPGFSGVLYRHRGFQTRPSVWLRSRSTITSITAIASLLRGLRPIVERRRPNERGYRVLSASFRTLFRLWTNPLPRRHVMAGCSRPDRAPEHSDLQCVSATHLPECEHVQLYVPSAIVSAWPRAPASGCVYILDSHRIFVWVDT